MLVPARRHAAISGSTESLPRYGSTVSASTAGGEPSTRPSRNASAYPRAVEPMSPRFPSAITTRPAVRAYPHTSSKARPLGAERLETPAGPSPR